MKKNLQGYLRFAVSIILLVYLFYQVDIKSSVAILSKANLAFVILAAFALLGNVYFSSLRIEYLLKIFKLNAKIIYLCELYLIGNFYNNFMPTQIGGDVYKAVRLSRDLLKDKDHNENQSHEIKAHSIFAIFMDRFSGLVLLYLISLIGLFINFGVNGLALAIFMLITSIAGYFLAIKLFARKIKILAKFKEANEIFFKNKNHIFSIFLSALMVQIFAVLTQLFCFWALDIKVDIIKAFLYIPIITLLGLVPSINGLGIQDAGYVYFFSGSNEELLAVSFLYHLVRFISSLAGGVLVLLKK